MSDKILNVRLQTRCDTEANWSSANPVLLKGEVAISSDKNGKYKVGDGTHPWGQLSYSKAALEKSDVVAALGYTPPTTDTKYSTGTDTVSGLTKLYTSTGSNTDGTITQSKITDFLNDKASVDHAHNYAGSSSAGGAANSVKSSLVVKLNGGSTEGTNMFTFNGSAAKSVNITPSSIGAAASSHGTHVSFGTSAPLAPGTASAGSATTVSRSDHRHPLQTTVSGNAGSATKLQTARKINGVLFDGTKDINVPSNYYRNLTDENLNEVLDYGEYYASGGNEVTNKPSSVDWFYLKVFRTSGGYIGQSLYSNGIWYDRFYNTASWGTWAERYSSVNKPTLSEIGAAASIHNHSASNISSGTLPLTRGGTGITVNPSMLVNLGSTTAVSVFAASPRPGITGTLPITNGGTGATSASAARTALGITPANIGAATSGHSHNNATTDSDGFMSSEDKTKLNGIATGANKYILPTASSTTLGGVKTTSSVTSSSGYTACPIISGVPYYKDTNTTYSSFSGATSSAAGSAGLVPAPAAGKNTSFLCGDGTWAEVATTEEVLAILD